MSKLPEHVSPPTLYIIDKFFYTNEDLDQSNDKSDYKKAGDCIEVIVDSKVDDETQGSSAGKIIKLLKSFEKYEKKQKEQKEMLEENTR